MKKSIVFSIIMALLLLLSACNTIEGQKDNSETSVAETISESRGPAENQSSDSENVPSDIKERFCDSERLRVYHIIPFIRKIVKKEFIIFSIQSKNSF